MRIICLGAILALGACDVIAPKEATNEPTAKVEEPAPPKEEPTETVVSEPAESLTRVMKVDGAKFNKNLSKLASANVEEGTATVSGDFSDAAPGGRTTGAVYRISGENELAVSGKTVEVQVTAKGGPLAMAYSTADVGNSGWKESEAAADWAPHTFRYAVPELKEGKGDFIGVIPRDAGAEVQIKSVKVFIVEK